MVYIKKLQELIDKKQKVWLVGLNDNGFNIKERELKEDDEIIENKLNGVWFLEDIYETYGDAQWFIDNYAERLLYFKPPTWNNIKDIVKEIKKSLKSEIWEEIFHCFNGRYSANIVIQKQSDWFCFRVTDHSYIGKKFNLTESGYKKAVKYARDEFLADYNVDV